LDKKYYITTPLYYVNAKPHIGHAYTNVLCDTFTRFYRFQNKDVFFMTGTDEHGTKIEKTAIEKGKTPQEYVDEIVPHFKSLWETLGIKHDFFIRTTDQQHKDVVRKVLIDLEAKGEIYKATYSGWYSIKSETFYKESELVEGRCPDTGGEVQKIEEENYFFKMSKYQEWLIDYIQNNPNFIQPEMRKNEVLGFLKEPLEDLCITRPKERLTWGIEYPGSENHVIYVWFDALINYISGAGYTWDDARFKSLWPADIHVVGKDILRHHAVFWPIMLKACGLEMPKTVLAHGWWTMQGSKMSKSTGNIVDPVELIAKYGVDPLRYFLMNEVTVGYDGAYSEDLLRERYRTDLANDLGNLFFRTASMIGKYYDSKLPEVTTDLNQLELIQQTYALYDQVVEAMEAKNPRQALSPIWSVISRANQFVEERAPWKLAKDPAQSAVLAETMFALADSLAHIACLLQAFLPATAEKMLQCLGMTIPFTINDAKDFRKSFLQSGQTIERGEPLFPKLEDEEAAVKS
jgi:methionyl-tRNA synthetase